VKTPGIRTDEHVRERDTREIEVQGGWTMRYLVHGEIVDPGYPVPPQQFAQYLESLVIPSLERLVKLEADGKVLAGGAPAGTRGTAFIVEAASNDEVGEILMSLPFWAPLKWQVTPLESWQSRVTRVRHMLEQVKATPR
jgi:predicted alpha/beta-hydrolase family hydrolase